MKAIAWIMNIVRVVILVIIGITVWPSFVGLAEGKVTWDEAVDSLFSNWIITLLLVVLGLTLLISIFRSAVARTIVVVALAAVIALFVTGNVTLNTVNDSVEAFDLANKTKAIAEQCDMNVMVEEFGGSFRAVLKDPGQEKILGYVQATADGVTTLVDTKGKKLPCKS